MMNEIQQCCAGSRRAGVVVVVAEERSFTKAALIHLGEFLQRDMVAVRVTGKQRAAIVGPPAYVDSHPRPKNPRELTEHSCIRYRMGRGGPIYRWEFEKRGNRSPSPYRVR
jgi:hypothetical protein